MHNILTNEHFWVYLALIIFLIIFGKLIYKQFIKFLEDQVVVIKDTINNSKKPLEISKQTLKKQQVDLSLLNKRIQNIKYKNKEMSNMLIESFYENLSLKTQYMEESFKNYLNNENAKQIQNLSNILINNSYLISLNILNNKLEASQKKILLNKSINKLDTIITSQINSNVT